MITMKKRLLSVLAAVCMLGASSLGALGESIRWQDYMRLPTAAEISAHRATGRAPYIVCRPFFSGSGGLTEYAVDFRADYLPKGTYLAVCNFDIDTGSLRKQYASVSRDYQGVGGYCGFQTGYDGKGYAIMTVWDTYCRDKAGKLTIIRATGVNPRGANFERFEGDTVHGEGCFIHCLVPYDWKAGRNYRALLQLYGSRLQFWVQDLQTAAWTQLMEYDLGYEGGFMTLPCAFLEDFSQNDHGEIRTMALSNFRGRDRQSGNWVRALTAAFDQNYDYSGSYNYGAQGNEFWAITTNLPGRCARPASYLECQVGAGETVSPY